MVDKGKHIVWISDFDLAGSGYLNISVPLCVGLADLGYEIIALGLGYAGNEYDFSFTITPCQDLADVNASVHNLKKLWGVDIIIVALDLPQQAAMHKQYQYLQTPYIAITPLEEGPLTLSWAMPLMGMDGVFFISELGKREAVKAGVYKAEHIEIGIDSQDTWKRKTEEDKTMFRSNLGLKDDDFVILTVAENQERKNLSASFQIVKNLKERTTRNIKWVLVTKEHNAYGHKLRDLASEYGINENLIIYERGMPQKNLWVLYAVADVFLLTSKAEGLGLPLMEAMSVGTLVVATHTGAIPELLFDNKGVSINPEYSFRDVWGNSRRNMINTNLATDMIMGMFLTISNPFSTHVPTMIDNARTYMESRTWDIPVSQLNEKITEILDGKAQ